MVEQAPFRYVRPVKAIWKGAVLAESLDTVVVDGNHYFPPDSLEARYFEDSVTRTT